MGHYRHKLETAIEYLKGVGPLRAELLNKEAEIFSFRDLLYYYPFRYDDRSKFYTISELTPDMPYVQIKGVITNFANIGKGRGKRLTAKLKDETGTIELIWFKGANWITKSIKPNGNYIVFGKPNYYNGSINIVHPEVEVHTAANEKSKAGLQPVYPSGEKLKSKGLHSKGISKLTQSLFNDIKPEHITENLPEQLIRQFKFLNRYQTLKSIHFPTSEADVINAQRRLKFEELFFLQLRLLKMKDSRERQSVGYEFKQVGDLFNRFYHEYLPFELTGAQKRVLKEIRFDTRGNKHMNRLLQGDVGSGKTIVAMMSMLIAADNGFQSCIMAPTEILATQHLATVKEYLEGLDVKVAFLSGSVKAKARRIIFEELANGEIDIIIGTHALIEDKVIFKNLGLVVIDEQHRFGVAQRARLWKKNDLPPHILVMTATPIPRTLAMTVYGDLDVSVIDELPPGRKEIKTIHRTDAARLRIFGFMREQIEIGRQIYIVYPLIEESEKLDLKDLMDGYESVVREFPLPDYQVSIVNGRMKPQEKDYEMERFVSGKTHIMVATTVIEVGVNVPNASVMVIENAERFGLSQLHQLRGRVGRGADQSYCILMTKDELSYTGKQRIGTMVKTNDGFEIAEADLKLRGPGDIEGTRQSGEVNLRLADVVKDQQMLKICREMAIQIIDDDPELEKQENRPIRNHIMKEHRDKTLWSKIS